MAIAVPASGPGWKLVLLALALLIGGAPADARDLLTIKSARSVAAEWALVNRAAADGRIGDPYVAGMREEARRQLGTALHTMKRPDSDAARLIARLASLPADADPAALEAGAAALREIERRLEPA